MKKSAWILTAVLLCAAARAGYCANKAGTGTAAFLKLPADARSAALGETSAASARGAMALFQNPAGLADGGASAAFSHALLAEDLSYDVLGAAVPFKGGVIGAGAQYLRYGSMTSLDNTGAPAGSLSPRDAAFALGYARPLADGVLAGAAAKYLDSRISGSASGAALDLGLVFNADDFFVGAAIQHLGKGLKFALEESPLPTNVKIGVMIPADKWQYFADFNFPKDGPGWAGGGAEYRLAPGGGWSLACRAGYNNAAPDAGGISGLTAGFGFELGKFTLDYALRAQGMLGSTHHLGLSYALGAPK
ncbi:MAG: hypothetical protein A2X32_07595 [Elusimicrobia bacterium GWC2_64_44]|nr:MAG: hypothetical protein A2X32_07595 [Elusimicrobia bacterium GWC2_64_44]